MSSLNPLIRLKIDRHIAYFLLAIVSVDLMAVSAISHLPKIKQTYPMIQRKDIQMRSRGMGCEIDFYIGPPYFMSCRLL